MKNKTLAKPSVFIRWCVRNDLKDILKIENTCEHPWTEKRFIESLRRRDGIGMVAQLNNSIVGYVTYRFRDEHLRLTNLVVHPEYRRIGIGTQIINKMKYKVDFSPRRKAIYFDIRETNLDMQLFLKKMDFRAIRIVHNAWSDTGEDTYRFAYRI